MLPDRGTSPIEPSERNFKENIWCLLQDSDPVDPRAVRLLISPQEAEVSDEEIDRYVRSAQSLITYGASALYDRVTRLPYQHTGRRSKLPAVVPSPLNITALSVWSALGIITRIHFGQAAKASTDQQAKREFALSYDIARGATRITDDLLAAEGKMNDATGIHAVRFLSHYVDEEFRSLVASGEVNPTVYMKGKQLFARAYEETFSNAKGFNHPM